MIDEAEATGPVVEFESVSRFFGDAVAVDAVSFSVRQGEFFSIIGPSGSGKTTTVRMIAGLEVPHRGNDSPVRPGCHHPAATPA